MFHMDTMLMSHALSSSVRIGRLDLGRKVHTDSNFYSDGSCGLSS